MPARLAVTGAAGFIGAHLVREGRRRGDAVLALDRIQAPLVTQCDILDVAALRSQLTDFQPDVVLHAAARTDLRGRQLQDYRENTDGTRNVLAAAQASGVRRFVHFSSRLVFRLGHEPRHDFDYSATTPYGLSKAVSEGIARSAGPGMEVCIVRPTSIWGPGFGAPYRSFFGAVRRGLYFHPRGREIWKDFGYVENAVSQVFSCVDDRQSVNGRVYWLKDPAIELGAFARLVAGRFEVPAPKAVPISVLSAAAAAGSGLELLNVEAPLTRFRLNNLLTPMQYAIGEAPAVAEPVSVEEGVRRTCAWILDQAD